MAERFFKGLQANLEQMDRSVSRARNPDVNRRLFRVYGHDAAVYVLDGMVSGETLHRFVLEKCMAHAETLPRAGDRLPDAVEALIPLTEIERTELVENAAFALMCGKAVMLLDGFPGALCMDIRAFVRRGISSPLAESVVNGPHEGFNEALRDNVTLLRRILRTPRLIGEMVQVGRETPVDVSIMYLRGTADEETLERVRSRLAGINVEHVLSIGALQQLIEDRPYSLFPQCCLTERPDRAASFLIEGQIVLVMDGSPQVLAAPISFLHLFHTPDDTSLRWQTGSFLRLLRWFGALCALLLPALFVACVAYHPQVLPVTLLTAVLEAQASVPLSIPAEAFLMLLMFNLIGEAATRVPGVVGSSLGTVSGLILGQAAVEARLIHPLLIIVVAVASLGSYAIPDYSMALAFRIGQLLLVAAASVFGFYGMVLTMTAALVRLCGMRSFGAPYTAPVAPLRSHNPDLYLRWPIWRQRLRTYLADANAGERAQGRMRAWDGEKDAKK